jgi:hypothetical protein
VPSTYTTGDLAKRFGVFPWQLVRAITRGFLPEPQRIGCYRVWTEVDLPQVEAALRAAGYLPEGGDYAA